MSTHKPYSREIKPEGWDKPRPPGYYVRAAEAQRNRRKSNPDKYRKIGRVAEHNRRLKRYGVTKEWYTEQLNVQKNLCDICLEILIPGRTTHIDHNHVTGQVRGLLCNHCNYLLGNAKENKLRLQQAINYLERYDVCPATL
jgi:RNase P subunit RPR2